tara:strand:+ start:11834 stop:12025 length:192 start_codon:yes stop_codon:yes gene_type:complete
MLSIFIALLTAIAVFFALIDVAFSRRPLVEKILWAVVIVMLPLLGILLYLLMGRSGRSDRHIA